MRLSIAAVVVLFGVQAAAYVLPARSVFKRFAVKQATDQVDAGPLTGRAVATLPGGEQRVPVKVQVKFPGECMVALEMPEAEASSVLQNGRVSSEGDVPALEALVALGCPLVTMKKVSASEAETALTRLAGRLGVDTKIVSLRQLEGRPAWVIGAKPRDEKSPQLWFDKETNRPVRIIATHAGQLWDVRYGDARSLATARKHPRLAEVWQGGTRKLSLSLRVDTAEKAAEETTEKDEAENAPE